MTRKWMGLLDRGRDGSLFRLHPARASSRNPDPLELVRRARQHHGERSSRGISHGARRDRSLAPLRRPAAHRQAPQPLRRFQPQLLAPLQPRSRSSLAAAHVLMLGIGLGWNVDPVRAMLIGLGLLFLGISPLLPRISSNPWTGIQDALDSFQRNRLASDPSGRRLHPFAPVGSPDRCDRLPSAPRPTLVLRSSCSSRW